MSRNDYDNLPSNVRPVSPWSYFGHTILYAIPILGFIFLLIHALGGSANVNIKNFARSYFCGIILALIIVGIAVGIAAATGGITKISEIIQQYMGR